MKKNNTRKQLVFILFLSLTIAFTIYLYADSDGKTGRTSSSSDGCGNCHGGSNSNVNLSVSSQTGSFTVLPNSVTTFTVTLTHPSFQYAGINIGVKTSPTQSPGINAGTLTPVAGSGLKLDGNPQELTQISPKPLSGGSVSFSFNWTAPSIPGTYYIRAVGLASNNNGQASGDEWNWMQVKEVIVSSGRSVTLTYPNGGEVFCIGSKVDITWNYNEVSFVKIELSNNDGFFYPVELIDNYPASTRRFSWTIPMTYDPGNTYRIRISDATNPTIYDESNASFTIMSATTIKSHPAKQSLCEGSTAVFSCMADGINLRYQWFKNNLPIQNATTPTYYINSIKPSDSGFYKVRVTGECGNPLFSDSAKLEVNLPPKILKQPEPATVCLGEKATFSVKAEGFNLFIQWQKDGKNINNAIGATYTIESVKESDAGWYSAHISGACPPKQTSEQVRLIVNLPPTITVQPQDQIVNLGDDVTLTCEATGTLPEYQWQKDGIDINNETGNSLTIKNIKESDAGNYTCVVKTICGTRTSRPAKISIRTLDQYAELSLASKSIDFGSVAIGSQKDTLLKNIIKNTGNIDLEITQIYISGSNASDFELSNIQLPKIIKPNESSDLSLRFLPTTEGNKSAQVEFVSNAQTNPSLYLTGNVINSVDFDLKNAFQILPIPAEDYILILLNETVNANSLTNELIIYNSIGEMIYSCQIGMNELDKLINISSFSQGVYFVRINDNIKMFVKVKAG